jgi:hypothetical protein
MYSTKTIGIIMIEKNRKALLGIFAAAVFAVSMTLNITHTEGGLTASLCGETALASDPGDLPCQEEPSTLFYDNINIWDPDNCVAEGEGCITCTVPAP